MPALLSLIDAEGSRHFGGIPQVQDWYAVRDRVGRLAGARVTGFLTDRRSEAWIDFTFEGHSFSINDHCGDYWFFVEDPDCPDAILHRVLEHFSQW